LGNSELITITKRLQNRILGPFRRQSDGSTSPFGQKNRLLRRKVAVIFGALINPWRYPDLFHYVKDLHNGRCVSKLSGRVDDVTAAVESDSLIATKVSYEFVLKQ